ncbi:DUF2637 domain-containing protein [Streptomyces sp. Ru87]|uniref:DUF2637 domain-containing protein n=1 Tax=Streptomyces sp. Ru87 TaxID=2044307 RepID=UPI000BFA3205|nr:DUF2637 domain-containing protein [Streptomyces sp. Ru87]PGH49696.1 hypothetical protein CRI70_16200 [Streptomyces sp. Ru87]
MSLIASTPVRISGWDRAAIVALGGAGCALSYDALQQMAIAIHVRGILTFLFPLVIDGFIAYGVRALLVLRTAPLASRCYVWMLFGTATAASIWANALHAVRLNQQQPNGERLRLGDLTVGVLSTLAPLALAGAVHLYILIARRVAEAADTGQPETPGVRVDRLDAGRPDTAVRRGEERPVPVTAERRTALSGGPAPAVGVRPDTAWPDTGEPADREQVSGRSGDSTEPESEHIGRSCDLGGQPVKRPAPVTALPAAEPPAATPDTGGPTSNVTGDRGPGRATDEQLLVIGRQAVTEAGNLTRQIVRNAIRSHGHTIGNDRLTVLMQHLRAETDKGPDTDTG